MNEAEMNCDVCQEGEDYDDDEIVICDLCNSAAHQSCYGGEIKNQLPRSELPWYCARC